MNERQSDFEWLQQFSRAGNQVAFRDLVRRHIDLVFATALRKVGDAGGAEEISQNVFGVLARNPVLLRTLFIDILGLGPTGLAARRRANQQLADLMLDVVNNRPGERKRKAPLQPMMAMAVVGGINEMVLHSIERDRAGQLQELVEPASTLLRAAISAEF